jgi:hypothetical protein
LTLSEGWVSQWEIASRWRWLNYTREGMGNVDRGPQTADGSRTGFPACEEERTVNEWGIETADRGRQTAVGRAFQPVGKRTVNEWGTNKRMGDGGRQTADGGPRRAGFPACQKTSIERGARKNFVPLCLCVLVVYSFLTTKTRRHKGSETRPKTAEWMTNRGRRCLSV